MAKSPKQAKAKDHSRYLAEVEARRVERTVSELEASLDSDQHQGRKGKRCLVCENPVFGTSLLCGACNDEFGPSAGWPAWLKFLESDSKQVRRQGEREQSAGMMDYDEDGEGNLPLEDYPPATFGEGYFPHGTHSGYAKHGCRCKACTEAHRLYNRRQMAP